MGLDPEAQVKKDLERLLPLLNAKLTSRFEHGEAVKVAEAMRYSLEAGGKRVRPLLCLLAAESVGADPEMALSGALALEYLHTYSLIHDDLPAMDDDDLRRGKPTCHVAFGEAHAILAGDGLQAEAFGVLAADASIPAEARVEAIALLAEASGWRGMVGGQALDLEGEGLETYGLDHLKTIHRLKTGALLRASLEMGAVLGGADGALREALRSAGAWLGLAFQIQDDILDATSDAAALGKRAGKDAEKGKITYPALLGLEGAQRALAEATENASCHLQSLPKPGSLEAWARYLAGRKV